MSRRRLTAWIDFENPPQVRYLLPCAEAFSAAGADVLLTARNVGGTVEMLESEGAKFTVIGGQFGRGRTRKVLGLKKRSRALRALITAHGMPDVSLSASRAAALVSRRARIPRFVVIDYEHVSMAAYRIAEATILHPDVIDPAILQGKGIRPDRLLAFRGLKEDISFAGIDVDAVEPYRFAGIDPGLLRVLVRPPAEESHYFKTESRELVLELLQVLSRVSGLVIVFAPREPWQGSYIDELSWPRPPIVLNQTVPFVSLLKGVDVVVSAGGTMLREAAYLGVPAYSVLHGRTGAVDRYLESIGRLHFISSADQFPVMQLARAVRKPLLAANPHLVEEIVEVVLDRARREVDRPAPVARRAETSTRTDVSPGQLQRLLSALAPVTVADRRSGERPLIYAPPGRGEPVWLQLGDWRLSARVNGLARPVGTAEIARFTFADGSHVSAWHDAEAGVLGLPFSPEEVYLNYISEAWFVAARSRRLSDEQLDLFYRVKRFVPRRAQLAGRRLFHRWQGLPDFPRWPLDDGVQCLLRFLAYCNMVAADETQLSFRWFWPGDNLAAIVLTHDVESVDGLREMVSVADLEEERGFRSSFNLGAWYRPDPGVLRELRSRGFEIGLHGIRHDRSMFASRAGFNAQQEDLRRLADSLGATGFRSPATHRVFEWLGELPVAYDCSMPHSDPFEPQPGGCCSVWPFLIGPVVELPYTLPQDHTTFTLLGHRTPDLWLDIARRIERRHGLIQCVTHPDPGYLGDARKRRLYAAFLDGIAERQEIWRALPRELAAWWRGRDAATGSAVEAPFTGAVAERGDAPDDVSFRPA